MIPRRPSRTMSQINVVPYIDVMLVLLVIFMVTAPFINPSQVQLPSVSKSSEAPAEPIEVTVRRDGSLMLRDRGRGGLDERISEQELPAAIRRLSRANKDRPVVI